MTVRSTLARFAACTALGWIAIGGASAVASAHAEFQTSRVNAGSTTSVTLDVPHERAPNVYNTIVRVQVPAGWSSPSCTSPAGWTCSSFPGEVAFSKADPSTIADATETFTFALTAPAATGTTTFPVVQIYNTGENVLWSSSAQLEVVAAPTPPTTSSPTTTTPGSSSTTSPSPTSSTTMASSTTSGPSSTAGGSTTQPSMETTSASSSGSGGTIAIIAIVILVLGGAAGTIVVLRKRS